MKKMNDKLKLKKAETVTTHVHREGRHSFLFWLVLPIILVWLSVGYLLGITGDKPQWFNKDETLKKTNPIVPYFQEHGSFNEILDQPFITLWFDDAWASQYTKAYPILKKNNFPGTIAVPVNLIETPNYMNWAQLRTIQKSGWEITNHSLGHDCEMDNWDRNRIVFEYKNSKHILWKNELTSDIFVTPCGVDSRVMQEEASKMFIAYRTVDPGYNDPENVEPYKLKVRNVDNNTTVSNVESWIQETKAGNYWTILVFHKIGDEVQDVSEDAYNTPLNDLNEVIEYIKESEIKVVTPSQIISSQNDL